MHCYRQAGRQAAAIFAADWKEEEEEAKICFSLTKKLAFGHAISSSSSVHGGGGGHIRHWHRLHSQSLCARPQPHNETVPCPMIGERFQLKEAAKGKMQQRQTNKRNCL